MPLNLSPYADAESGAPSWRKGERESAIVFLSLTIYIILDVNVGIYRVFKKKRGLYYWSLICATWGTLVVALGNIFKNLKPEWGVIWPLWTLMINGGWSVYAPAECLVLYSRLHLVNQNERLHRWLLWMIIVGSTLIIIPNWVFVFGAYDIDPKVSSVWSPRMAIIDRASQAGFTLFEWIISSIYISSLLEILKTKINTRTRRVMRDLILMNITVILMDLIVIILIFLDQANLAYPLQDFTYAFKFKIEFAVLNQLMAVAASGARHGSSKLATFEERRYRRPGQATIMRGYSDDDLSGVRLPFLSLSTNSESSPQGTVTGSEKKPEMLGREDSIRSAKVAKPVPALSKAQARPNENIAIRDMSEQPKQSFDFQLPSSDVSNHHGNINLEGITKQQEAMGSLREKDSDDTLLVPAADDIDVQQRRQYQQRKPQRNSLRSMLFGRHTNPPNSRGGIERPSSNQNTNVIEPKSTTVPGAAAPPASNPNPEWDRQLPDTNTPTRRARWRTAARGNEERERNDDDDDDDEEGLHEWDRHSKPVQEAPWFQKVDEPEVNTATRSEGWE